MHGRQKLSVKYDAEELWGHVKLKLDINSFPLVSMSSCAIARSFPFRFHAFSSKHVQYNTYFINLRSEIIHNLFVLMAQSLLFPWYNVPNNFNFLLS